MKPEAALSLLSQYERLLAPYADPVERMCSKPSGREEALGHIRTMLTRMRTFVIMGEAGKFSGWLGFAQGVFFAHGVFTVDEMRDQNRPIFKGSSNES